MTQVWTLAAVRGLALLATLLAIVFRISTALLEIGVGIVAQLGIGKQAEFPGRKAFVNG